MSVADDEVARRRRKYDQIAAAQARDTDRLDEIAKSDGEREERRIELLAMLADLQSGGSAADFRTVVDAWSRKPGYSAFNSPHGQMFLNQLVGAAPDEEVAEFLRRALTLPPTVEAARAQMVEAVEFVASVRKGAYPAPARVPFLCSFFWGLQEPLEWPIAWPSSMTAVAELSWLEYSEDLVVDYLAFRSMVLDLGVAPTSVAHTFYWFDSHRFVGLDPSLIERCQRAFEITTVHRAEGRYISTDQEAEARRHARAVLAELKLLGRAYQERIAEAVGRSVKAVLPGPKWDATVYRADGWMSWRVGTGSGAGIRVWATLEGIGIGVYCGHYRAGWYDEVPELVAGKVPDGARAMAVAIGDRRVHPEEDGFGRECLIGWWHDGEELLDQPDLGDLIVRRASELQPVLDALLIGADQGHSTVAPGLTPTADPNLLKLKAMFITERSYPTDRDEHQWADREQMAKVLQPEELPIADLGELRSIINTSRYGNPGPQSILNTSLRDADPAELESILQRLSYLCWGDGKDEDPAIRLDRMLDPEDLGLCGLGESVMLKLLSITDPERFLPVFPYLGDMGKLRMLKLLELSEPSPSLSRGERQIQANDTLRARLDPLFPGDPWGQAQFLFWLNSREEPLTSGPDDEVDELAELAERLLVPKSFLEDIVALLEDKGQVVLYGPPGTGKTYLARELARVLAPDPNRRMLVQFHPSTTYEDFFEGYRPEETEGQLSYRLTKGPLALLADRAEQAPGQRHVMIIDEINRANLPKVLGEMLFLLEYRHEAVRTLYRPDDTFELPKDLWFIGTMNTADRSIALIDAALRRRFHFVPFFPNSGPMEGLLGRWLAQEEEPAWIAELVDMVNAELVDELGGPHLQLGPSHFMRKDLDEAALERIWSYNIFPFIEDQLFGEPERIARYGFTEVLKRFRTKVAPDAPASEEQAADPAAAGAEDELPGAS